MVASVCEKEQHESRIEHTHLWHSQRRRHPKRPERGERFDHHGRPDRDLDDVAPEVNDARKALKKAIKEAIRRDPEEDRRVAEILRRAAQEIREGYEEDTTEVDLG